MRIITISREFGSGGRELGKRLAEELGIPSYWQLYRYQGVDEKRNTVLKHGCLDSVFWLFFSN